MAAASPFNGSTGLGYVNNCGRKDSKIFDKSVNENRISYNVGFHDWCQYENKREMEKVWQVNVEAKLLYLSHIEFRHLLISLCPQPQSVVTVGEK